MTPVPDPDPNPILYACFAHATTVLAELYPADDGAGHDLLPDLAARCLAAAPRFHRHYSHTAGGRIYAFLIDGPLVFFAIADEALLGKPRVLLFLRRLRDASFSSAALRRLRRGGFDPLYHLCLQQDFLSELRRLALSVRSLDEEPSPPRPCPPPPAASPQSAESNEDQKGREKKGGKGKSKMLTSVVDGDNVGSDPVNGGPRSVRKVWRQHVRTIILIDLVVCCLLLGVWVSICRGFECITH